MQYPLLEAGVPLGLIFWMALKLAIRFYFAERKENNESR
jgi:hypothetical protein